MGVGQSRNAALRPAGAAESPQRGNSGYQVQQPSLQGGHGGQRGRGPLSSRQTDHHHEDRDQRQRDRHDHSRFQVVEPNNKSAYRGQDRRQQQRRKIGGEIGPQR